MNPVCITPRSPHSQLILCVSDIVVINADWFLGYFVGNTLWLIAIGYYLYITFLGYNGKFHLHLNALSLVVLKFKITKKLASIFFGMSWTGSDPKETFAFSKYVHRKLEYDTEQRGIIHVDGVGYGKGGMGLFKSVSFYWLECLFPYSGEAVSIKHL